MTENAQTHEPLSVEDELVMMECLFGQVRDRERHVWEVARAYERLLCRPSLEEQDLGDVVEDMEAPELSAGQRMSVFVSAEHARAGVACLGREG